METYLDIIASSPVLSRSLTIKESEWENLLLPTFQGKNCIFAIKQKAISLQKTIRY